MNKKLTTIAALLVVLALCLTGCNSSAAASDSASAVDAAEITASAAAGQTTAPAAETAAPVDQTAAPAEQTAVPNEQEAGAEATAAPVAENTAAPAETPTEAPAEAPTEEPVTEPVDEEPSGIEAICGEYFEVIAGRGTLVITAIDDETVAISIDWGSSAAEVATWQMTGTYHADTNSVFYSDCIHKILTYTEDGACTEELVYENGTGHFDFATGTAGWTDDQSENPDSPSTFAKEGYMP